MKKNLFVIVTIAGSLALVVPTVADGLFGEGGLFRGDVGNFLDEKLEKPVLTPVARTTAVIGGATAGAAVRGKAGAVVGAGLGQAVNEALGPGKSNGAQTAAVETGQTCSTTAIGAWPLPNPLPLGTECFVKLENGAQVTGTTIKQTRHL